jgi:hypothetical protein
VRQLRAYLLRAAQRPAGVTDELEQLLQCKLAVSTHEIEELFNSSSMTEASSSSSSQVQPQQLQELESGLDHMLQLFSKAEVFRLLQQQPALLLVPLASWCEFFTGYGFSSSQIKNLISQTRGEVMTKSDLVTAGTGAGAITVWCCPAVLLCASVQTLLCWLLQCACCAA